MKKVFLFIAFALGLSASVANAQRTARTATVSGRPVDNNLTIALKGRKCQGVGFSCIQIDLLRAADAQSLKATSTRDAAGNITLRVNPNQNPELVRQLRANGALELDADVVLSQEVSQALTGRAERITFPKGRYPVVGGSGSGTDAKGITIIIKWKNFTITIEF